MSDSHKTYQKYLVDDLDLYICLKYSKNFDNIIKIVYTNKKVKKRIKKEKKKFPIYFNKITLNQRQILYIYKNYADKFKLINVDWHKFYYKDLSLDFIVNFQDKDWDFKYLSRHNNFDFKWVEELPDKDWDFKYLSRHNNFNFKWVEELPNKDWDFKYLSRHNNFDFKWVEELPDKNWDFKYLSRHNKLTVNILSKMKGGCIDWNELSHNNNITVEWLIKFPNGGSKNWNWDILSKHKNLTLEWLEILPDKNWNYNILSKHINCNIDWLEKFPDKNWDYSKINLDNALKIVEENCRKEYLAAYRIQQWWYKITLSPYYKIGRKFINKKYDLLFNEK